MEEMFTIAPARAAFIAPADRAHPEEHPELVDAVVVLEVLDAGAADVRAGVENTGVVDQHRDLAELGADPGGEFLPRRLRADVVGQVPAAVESIGQAATVSIFPTT